MNKLLFGLVLLAISFVSCSKDKEEEKYLPLSLDGTAWRTHDYSRWVGVGEISFVEYKFISNTSVEKYTKINGEGIVFIGSYLFD